MSLTDLLKCPGPDRSVAAVPETYPCPDCGQSVEIWTDETKRKCPDCGTVIQNRRIPVGAMAQGTQGRPNKKIENDIKKLIQEAMTLGLSRAVMIPSADISVENDLASLCGGDPPCDVYGLSPSCPPHVPGPPGFREWQQKSPYAIVTRIDVPTSVMYSEERRDIMRLLHEIVAGIEQKAAGMGYRGSKAFAGGSCKKIFCRDHTDCRVLSGKGDCRNPASARPSMSGFGINVAKLMQSAGWPAKNAGHEKTLDPESMTWVAGLVLIASE